MLVRVERTLNTLAHALRSLGPENDWPNWEEFENLINLLNEGELYYDYAERKYYVLDRPHKVWLKDWIEWRFEPENLILLQEGEIRG
jgi:hypothetical protein